MSIAAKKVMYIFIVWVERHLAFLYNFKSSFDDTRLYAEPVLDGMWLRWTHSEVRHFNKANGKNTLMIARVRVRGPCWLGKDDEVWERGDVPDMVG